MNEKVDIGALICSVLEEQGRKKGWLAKQLGRDPSNFNKLLTRPSMDTALLVEISKILKHNFFNDISQALDISDK